MVRVAWRMRSCEVGIRRRVLRTPWPYVLALAFLQCGFALWILRTATPAGVTYVFTPLVDVVPSGPPLSATEAAALQQDLRTQIDARDIQQAYARLGSTMRLDDLVVGIDGLAAAGAPLDAAQHARVADILARARDDHAALRAVQSEILTLEARIAGNVAALGVSTTPLR